MFQAHRLVFSHHLGLPLSLVVQYVWEHWKAVLVVRTDGSCFPRSRLRTSGSTSIGSSPLGLEGLVTVLSPGTGGLSTDVHLVQ